MADPDSESAPDPDPTPDPNLAAIRRKLNWLTAAVILLFVIEISRFVGAVSISGHGSTLILFLGGGIIVIAALLVRLTPKYE
ncbi:MULTISPECIES: hypothetical protein [unclassified Haladaptatus]|uniref:hypothetical protein n=1 Tax=unclassified Haladaptatus TaxID=2622732 RepID=UPI00209C12D7|nr:MULTISPECIES: hypothetical protein [unclassified Haladaptatus]MCO8242835.1 hypothetical protein [Haladaptatus sp. AB643]MCO8252595.1 hypothetical protein [Haladaptatus sp. AB618]